MGSCKLRKVEWKCCKDDEQEGKGDRKGSWETVL